MEVDQAADKGDKVPAEPRLIINSWLKYNRNPAAPPVSANAAAPPSRTSLSVAAIAINAAVIKKRGKDKRLCSCSSYGLTDNPA